jgi:hypothetical protein
MHIFIMNVFFSNGDKLTINELYNRAKKLVDSDDFIDTCDTYEIYILNIFIKTKK